VKCFLYPSLDAISKILRLSESVAGVTFLALGNGAADIFSLVVLMAKEDRDGFYAETAMGGIMGGGLFVTSVVVGLICFNYQLRVKPAPFLRDVLFYLAAVTWLVLMVIDGKIIVGEAVGFIGLYLLYVSFVLVSLKLEKRNKDSEEKQPLLGDKLSEETTVFDGKKSSTSEQTYDKISGEVIFGNGDVEETNLSERSLDASLTTTRNQCYQFLIVLCPCSKTDFLTLKYLKFKVCSIEHANI
jgi:Ca2+/Na+ antiporter